MIDTDQDNFISKKDMIKFLTMERFGKKIFPYNHVKAIELMDLPRSDKINLEQFKKVHQIALFLCFPAFKLQERLRNRVIGETFWENLYKKIHEDETDENKKKQRSKMEEEKKKKAEGLKFFLVFSVLSHFCSCIVVVQFFEDYVIKYQRISFPNYK